MSDDVINVGITADPSGLVSGFNTATNTVVSGSEQMSTAVRAAGSAFTEFAAGIVGAFAAGFGIDKVIELGTRSVETADKLEKMSQQIGINTEALSALQSQAALADVGFDQFGQAMTRLARSSVEAAQGGKQQAAAYEAIGVSVKNAAGQVRPMADILQDVATKLASYQDGAQKTALAQELMGRGGAQLIPMLNELGTQGFQKVTEDAKAYNQVIGEDQAKASEALHDNITRVQMSVSGLANAVMAQLLPSLVSLSGEMADGAKTTNGYAETATVLANAIKSLGLAFDVLVNSVRAATTVVAASADALGIAISLPIKAGIATAQGGIDGLKGAFTTAFTQIKGAAAGLQGGLSEAFHNVTDTFSKLFGPVTQGASAAGDSIKKLAPPLMQTGDAAEKAGKQAREMDAAFDALQTTLDGLAGKLGGPYTQADAAYLEGLTKIQNQAEAFVIADGDVNTALAKWQEGEELLADNLEKTTEQLDRQADFLTKMKQTWDDDTRLLGLDNDAHAVMEAVIKAETEARNLYYQGLRDSPNLTDAERNAVEQAASAHEHLVEAVNNSKQVQQDFVNTWKTGFDSLADDIGKFFTGQINSWSDFGKSLVGIAQQIVGDIISQFIKLEFINPILNGLFGAAAGNGSLLPTLESAGGLLGGGGGASSGGVSGGSSGSSLLGDSTSLFSTGQRIWGGIQNGWLSFMNQSPNAGYSMFGSYTGAQGGLMYAPTAGGSELGLVPDYANGGAESIGVAPGSYGYTPSPLGYGLAAAGGLYAGYNEFQNAGGGAAGALGGAAYGVGTYTLGIAGGAALTGGLGAGLATIGPVGWAALALMAVDMISGGKLFGTKGKFNFGEQAINVGSQGATVTAGYDLKGQKALFGGSTHSWQTVDASPEAQAAADQFFAQLKTGTDQFAKQFGQTVGDVVGGTFTQTFDKKGNITATSDTVLGKTYAGEDEGKFTERLDAENMLAVLDKFSAGISAAVDQYRVDAAQLAAVTQSLAAAGLYLKNGGNLMALGADQSLTALLKLAQGSQAFGETIDQTITRLVQAQQQYDQFVGQFKPADTFASPFQAALADIDTQMVSNIAQANALAQAAGAEGAATQDLVNIHNYAAQQFAAAVAKLKVDTNALAAQLGYADSQNLGDLNSQIAALESQQQSAAHATNGLSNAVQSYTQKAIAAMNLLLGDLSPYNDQQKLQMALQGQQAGTVTPDQVLEIARRLDATGADYKAIFDQVMAIGDRTQHGSAGGGGGGASFSSADAAHLAQLQAERDKLAAAQRHTDALTEAQNIADLVSSTGESIDQALADAGIKDLTPFLKDLGLTNESDFDDLITKLEQNTDSAGDSTNVLASKIDLTNTLLGQIVTQGGGTPAAGDTGSGAGSGHSGHASGDSDDLTQALRENTHSNRDLTGVLRQGRDGGQRGTRQPVNVTRTR